MTETAYAIAFLLIFLLLVGIAQWLYRGLHVSAEGSRKFLHVSGGLLALAAPLFFRSQRPVLLLCGLAFLMLLVTFLKNWLPAVHRTRRNSIGSVLFPIPIYLCFVIAKQQDNDLLFYLPVSLLTISDALAEWAGARWAGRTPVLVKGQKTLAGSTAFGLSALLLALAWGRLFQLNASESIAMAMVIASVATITELVSTGGWDNLTVPLVSLSGLLLLLEH